VESAYQRRNDLIGNLCENGAGAADFGKNTLTAVIEAGQAFGKHKTPPNITPWQSQIQ